MNKAKRCRICGDRTTSAFNIKFKAIPICDECGDAITLQNMMFYINRERKERSKTK